MYTNSPKYKGVIDNPTFPYCLKSYDDANLYPLSEFWVKGRPYLYCGSESGPEGKYYWYYDLRNKKEIKIDVTEQTEAPKKFGVCESSFYGEWPLDYINTMESYKFHRKIDAKNHGHDYRSSVLLVLRFNEEWGLFRFTRGNFKTVFIPRLFKELLLF